MTLMRSVFLRASNSSWLHAHATHFGFMRRSVERFLPGEGLDNAVAAAANLAKDGIFSVLSHLGENVTQRSEAEAVTAEYIEALGALRRAGIRPEISVKLTQLGMDLDQAFCSDNLLRILESSAEGQFVWVDMENSPYVDVTLAIYRSVRETHPNAGICIQAYLFRTEKDLASLVPMGAAVRLVKGAYSEPPEIAFAEKFDVDVNFLYLAKMLLGPEARTAGVRAAIATHDRQLIGEICRWAAEQGIQPGELEFQMLYGIKRAEQNRLASGGYRSGVHVSYGTYWFPWFMRRLAERPANAWFVARNLLGR
jgi:proline dehydrogenase